jgi:hypothetical protein
LRPAQRAVAVLDLAVVQQRLGVALVHDAALVEDAGAVADLQRALHVLLHRRDRRAIAFRAQKQIEPLVQP